jgi:fatty-acyl-CoA synthase
VLVAAPSFKTSDYAGMIEEVRSEVPTLERVVLLGARLLGRAVGRG